MLMPSFCWPLVVGPKPAMTRPFAGQRNFGSAPVPSADFTPSVAGGGSTGVTMLAVCAGGSGSFGGAAVVATGFGCAAAVGAGLGVTLGFAAETCAPGITRRSPILSGDVSCMLLAL